MGDNKEEDFKMSFDLLQPWSTFVLRTKLPPPILEKMIKISDEIVENRMSKADNVGAGQMEDQFMIPMKILKQEDLMEFFLGVCNNFVIQAFYQAYPFDKEQIDDEKWQTQLSNMWINSQKDNEYFPVHNHKNCLLSSVMYLKIPEYLPNRRLYQHDKIGDGSVVFTNNVSTNKIWGFPTMSVLPQVGDFFIFPAEQLHEVYPFRTTDGKGERRSVSFNAVFSNKEKK